MSIEGRHSPFSSQEDVLRAPYASLEERGQQGVILKELSSRTPSTRELFDLLGHLNEPVTGTPKRSSDIPVQYSRDEIKQISEGVLQGEVDLTEVPQTFGLSSLVHARLQLDQLQQEDVRVGLIAPPLTIAQFTGLLGNLTNIERPDKTEAYYTSGELLVSFKRILTPDGSTRMMPQLCGLRKICRGVLSPLP